MLQLRTRMRLSLGLRLLQMAAVCTGLYIGGMVIGVLLPKSRLLIMFWAGMIYYAYLSNRGFAQKLSSILERRRPVEATPKEGR